MAADPLANSGQFFGMTTLGATDPFFDNAASTSQYRFHDISEDTFLDAFEQNVLGDCEISQTLQVDGSSYILRGELPERGTEPLLLSPSGLRMRAGHWKGDKQMQRDLVLILGVLLYQGPFC